MAPRWKLSHREHFERLSNPDSHRSKYLVSFGHQHSDVVRPFQVAQFDGLPAPSYALTAAIF